MENVVDAVQDGTSAAENSAGSPETGEELRSSPGSDETRIEDSIPIIKLDPNEIVSLKIEPKPPEQERLTVEMKPPLTYDATNLVDKLSEEIVFRSIQKKKVRKKAKRRLEFCRFVIDVITLVVMKRKASVVGIGRSHLFRRSSCPQDFISL